MNSPSNQVFIDTMEYRRFLEFCNACREYRYIGLCYGPPGVGKTLSARHFANWDKVGEYSRFKMNGIKLREVIDSHVVFYTVPIMNTPNMIRTGIKNRRKHLNDFLVERVFRQKDSQFAYIEKQQEYEEHALQSKAGLERERAQWDLSQRIVDWRKRAMVEHYRRRAAVKDPTDLVIIDEADRLKMASLEQLRDVFDEGGVGLVLIGMPGLEKRLARYPQLYSRVGFVHEYRALSQDSVRQLLHDRWCPLGITLPKDALSDSEGVNAIIRVTGGNFRLLHRLLTQIGRVLDINGLETVTPDVVDAARESLVVGTE